VSHDVECPGRDWRMSVRGLIGSHLIWAEFFTCVRVSIVKVCTFRHLGAGRGLSLVLNEEMGLTKG
jgi:hypothetical protein